MQNLRNKVAVVTGGASGIGLAMAERFAREGMKLVLADAMSASDVADRVFDSIVDERFYVLTHEEIMPAVQLRLTNILENRNPEPLLFPDGMPSFIDPVSR